MNLLLTKLISAMDPMTIGGMVLLGVLLIALFVLPSFTNKKRQKQIAELYKSVEVGDRIKTVGGIIGTVVEINEINAIESEIVLETGSGNNKTTLVFDMQAVYQNMSKMAQPISVDEEPSEENDQPSTQESENTEAPKA